MKGEQKHIIWLTLASEWAPSHFFAGRILLLFRIFQCVSISILVFYRRHVGIMYFQNSRINFSLLTLLHPLLKTHFWWPNDFSFGLGLNVFGAMRKNKSKHFFLLLEKRESINKMWSRFHWSKVKANTFTVTAEHHYTLKKIKWNGYYLQEKKCKSKVSIPVNRLWFPFLFINLFFLLTFIPF